jgi:hypothetical protein
MTLHVNNKITNVFHLKEFADFFSCVIAILIKYTTNCLTLLLWFNFTILFVAAKCCKITGRQVSLFQNTYRTLYLVMFNLRVRVWIQHHMNQYLQIVMHQAFLHNWEFLKYFDFSQVSGYLRLQQYNNISVHFLSGWASLHL